MGKTVLGVIGGSGFYQMKGLDRGRAGRAHDAVRPPLGPVLSRQARRVRRGLSLAPRPRPSHDALRAEFPRQHLRHETARRRSPGLGQHRRQHEGGTAAGRPRGARPVHRPHLQAAGDVFRRRNRRTRLAGRPGVRGARARAVRGGRRRRRDGPSAAACICASRGRSFPPAPSRISTGAGAST